MTNPILQAMGKSAMPNSPMNVVQQFMQFKQQMQGKDPQLTKNPRQLRALLCQGRISSSQPEGSSKRNKPVRSWARTQKSERFSSFAVSRRDLPSK